MRSRTKWALAVITALLLWAYEPRIIESILTWGIATWSAIFIIGLLLHPDIGNAGKYFRSFRQWVPDNRMHSSIATPQACR